MVECAGPGLDDRAVVELIGHGRQHMVMPPDCITDKNSSAGDPITQQSTTTILTERSKQFRLGKNVGSSLEAVHSMLPFEARRAEVVECAVLPSLTH